MSTLAKFYLLCDAALLVWAAVDGGPFSWWYLLVFYGLALFTGMEMKK